MKIKRISSVAYMVGLAILLFPLMIVGWIAYEVWHALRWGWDVAANANETMMRHLP